MARKPIARVRLVDTVTGEDISSRYVTENPERFRLFRLCDCPTCEGSGKELIDTSSYSMPVRASLERCRDCRGEGRIRQEIATCATPEAVGVALVTLGREGEWTDCPFGLLDSEGAVNEKWLVRPWLPSARNVSDAARTLAKSKRTDQTQ